jgi:archaellum component FlaC
MKNESQLIEAHIYHIRESLRDLRDTNKDILNRLTKTEKVLLRNTITVEDHKRRSDLLEANQQKFLETLDSVAKSFNIMSQDLHKIQLEIEPIKKHVTSVQRIMSLLIAIQDNKATILKIIIAITIVLVTVGLSIKEPEFMKGLLK